MNPVKKTSPNDVRTLGEGQIKGYEGPGFLLMIEMMSELISVLSYLAFGVF